MQNAQNLMSSFEFIAALMSIIIGLGVDQSARGRRSRVLSPQRKSARPKSTLSSTLATLLLLVLQWWVTFKWNTEITWSFDRFLVLIVWTITLYMLTVFLYPPDLSEAEEQPAPLPTKPCGLLFRVHCDVRARHRTNRDPRRSTSSNLVCALCRSLRRPRCGWPPCASTRLRFVSSSRGIN